MKNSNTRFFMLYTLIKHGFLTNQNASRVLCYNYRLTHSASELSGFTCTSSLTMNEKFGV